MRYRNTQRPLCKIASKLQRNSSNILTCVGAVGVISTSISSVKATPKAIELIKKAEHDKGEPLTKFEIVKTVGFVYTPSILIGASTIACIFGANVLNKKNQAALMSAYALIDNSFKEYKNKVKELYGENADTDIRNSIAVDKFKNRRVRTDTSDNETFYDEFSDRFFNSTMEKVITAEYELNRNLALKGFATLNEFYKYLGLPPIVNGDAFGWSLDAGSMYYGYSWIDFEHVKVDTEDGDDPNHEGFYRLIMTNEPSVNYDLITDPDINETWSNRVEMRKNNAKKQKDI